MPFDAEIRMPFGERGEGKRNFSMNFHQVKLHFLEQLGSCDTAGSYDGEEDAKHHFVMQMIEIWPVDMAKIPVAWCKTQMMVF